MIDGAKRTFELYKEKSRFRAELRAACRAIVPMEESMHESALAYEERATAWAGVDDVAAANDRERAEECRRVLNTLTGLRADAVAAYDKVRFWPVAAMGLLTFTWWAIVLGQLGYGTFLVVNGRHWLGAWSLASAVYSLSGFRILGFVRAWEFLSPDATKVVRSSLILFDVVEALFPTRAVREQLGDAAETLARLAEKRRTPWLIRVAALSACCRALWNTARWPLLLLLRKLGLL